MPDDSYTSNSNNFERETVSDRYQEGNHFMEYEDRRPLSKIKSISLIYFKTEYSASNEVYTYSDGFSIDIC